MSDNFNINTLNDNIKYSSNPPKIKDNKQKITQIKNSGGCGKVTDAWVSSYESKK